MGKRQENITTSTEFIRAMRDLFGPNGEHWTQDYSARDSEGYPADPYDFHATSFCLLGCKHRVIYSMFGASVSVTPADEAEHFLREAVKIADPASGRVQWNQASITYFNDTLADDFSDIAAVLDMAIELSEAQNRV